MSVPVYKRNESRMIFLNKTKVLGQELVTFVNNLPSKYRLGLGDEMQRMLVHALQNGKLANSIYALGTKGELHERRYHLLQMAACIDTISTVTDIIIDTYCNMDGLSQSKVEKLIKKQNRIGKDCEFITRCIHGLIESDINLWNKQHPYNKVGKRWRMKSAVGDVAFSHNMYAHRYIDPEDWNDSNEGSDEFPYGSPPKILDKSQNVSGSSNSTNLDNLMDYDQFIASQSNKY